eukprot:scaffold3953_cov79-Isochrysis_galbana.AAC.1
MAHFGHPCGCIGAGGVKVIGPPRLSPSWHAQLGLSILGCSIRDLPGRCPCSSWPGTEAPRQPPCRPHRRGTRAE